MGEEVWHRWKSPSRLGGFSKELLSPLPGLNTQPAWATEYVCAFLSLCALNVLELFHIICFFAFFWQTYFHPWRLSSSFLPLFSFNFCFCFKISCIFKSGSYSFTDLFKYSKHNYFEVFKKTSVKSVSSGVNSCSDIVGCLWSLRFLPGFWNLSLQSHFVRDVLVYYFLSLSFYAYLLGFPWFSIIQKVWWKFKVYALGWYGDIPDPDMGPAGALILFPVMRLFHPSVGHGPMTLYSQTIVGNSFTRLANGVESCPSSDFKHRPSL